MSVSLVVFTTLRSLFNSSISPVTLAGLETGLEAGQGTGLNLNEG